MSSKVKNCISFEDLLHIRVICSKSMVRASRFREEKAHRITLIAESRLNSDEDVPVLFAIDEEILSIGVQVPRRLSPVLFESSCIRSQLLVLADVHLVDYVEIGAVELGLLVVDDFFDQGLGRFWKAIDVVAIVLELLEDGVDGREDIEVGSSSYIAFVWREAEYCDC